ncbi:MAG: hypothetical protein E7111_06365 [Bacteroidales bacterium]|nr:hypothetical protein [Bacteroidales bacterium]
MKLRNYILGLIASVAVFAGCEKEADLGPATLKALETAITLPLEGGSQTINLKATRDWTATVSPADCGIVLSPASGSGSNDAQVITVSAPKNTGRNISARITIKSGSLQPVLVSVTQSGELGALYYAEEIYGLANDTEVKIEGIVVGVNTKGAVIKDNTGLALVYDKEATAAPAEIGKKVKVEGKVGIYGDLKQVVPTSITVSDDPAVEVNHGEPVVADAEYLATPVLNRVYYMTLTGIYKPSADKKYHNVLVSGASKQGSLQYPVQDLSSAVDHNVKFYGYFAGGNDERYYNFLVTSYEDLGELQIEMMTIAQVYATENNMSVKTQGTVVAVNQSSFVLKDDTGVIYVYVNAAPGVKVGDDVEVSGLRDNYNGLNQISSPTITAKGTTSQVDYGTPASIKTMAALDTYMTSWTSVEYVEVEGVVNGYYVYPSGEGSNGVAPYYYDGDLGVYDGMTVTLCGYSLGKNRAGDKLNVILTSVETDPFISAKDVAVSAKTTSAKIEVVSNVEWTVSCSAEWITSYAKSTTEEGVIDVAFDANTSTEADRTATFTITSAGMDPVEVTLTQYKVSAAVSYSLVTSIDDIVAGEYVITFKHSDDDKYYALSNAAATKNPAGVEVVPTDDALSNVSQSVVWVFTGDNTNGFVISAATNYLNATGDGTEMIAVAGDDTQKWNVVSDETYGFMMLNEGVVSNRYLVAYNHSSGMQFRYYKKGSSYKGKINLFKFVAE